MFNCAAIPHWPESAALVTTLSRPPLVTEVGHAEKLPDSKLSAKIKSVTDVAVGTGMLVAVEVAVGAWVGVRVGVLVGT